MASAVGGLDIQHFWNQINCVEGLYSGIYLTYIPATLTDFYTKHCGKW